MFREVALEAEAHTAEGAMKIPFPRVDQLLVLVFVAPSPEPQPAFATYERPLAAVRGALVLHEEVLVAELHVAFRAGKGPLVEMYCADVLVEVAALLEGGVTVRA